MRPGFCKPMSQSGQAARSCQCAARLVAAVTPLNLQEDTGMVSPRESVLYFALQQEDHVRRAVVERCLAERTVLFHNSQSR
jgi:hypothetical protein